MFPAFWVANVATHQIQKLFEFEVDINSFKWSPDGKYIAFLAESKKATKKQGSEKEPMFHARKESA